MKGVVFTEFMDMVEAKFGLEIADRIIGEAALPSNGAYTAIGTYDHRELIALVGALSAVTGNSAAVLVRSFGEHLFDRFKQIYPVFFEKPHSAFDFLETVDKVIHVEVRKLYPDAELPSFQCERRGDDRFILTYRSTHPFGDLAEGLIRACCRHFGKAIAIEREAVDDNLNGIRFTLTKLGE